MVKVKGDQEEKRGQILTPDGKSRKIVWYLARMARDGFITPAGVNADALAARARTRAKTCEDTPGER